MAMSVDQALAVTSDLKKVHARLTILHDLGLGYLTLGEETPSLSGGEVKRIEIATILARRGQLMIFDEPEAGIDLWSFARLTETFEQIHREGAATMVIISHQERIIKLADEIVVIAGGQIAHRGTTEEIFPLILADTLGSCPVLERKEGAQ